MQRKKVGNSKCHQLKNVLLTVLTLIFAVFLTLNQRAAKAGILTGAKYCLELLIPSLFPLMFLSRFAFCSGIGYNLKKPFRKITKTLFYLPPSAVAVMILSLVGGYPVGAIGAKTLISKKEINKEQLNRLMCFSVNAGPGFIIDIVGRSLLKSKFLGVMIFLIQVTFSLFYAVMCGIIARLRGVAFYEKNSPEKNKPKISQAFVTSAAETATATINMCALILIFSVVITAVQSYEITKITNMLNFWWRFGLNEKSVKCLCLGILEVTSGCIYALKNHVSLPVICFLVAFGGLCTHMQITSILAGEKFSLAKFSLMRVLNAFFSSIMITIFLKFFETDIPVFFSSENTLLPSASSGALGSTLLLALCVKLTLAKSKNLKNKSEFA